MLEGSSSTKESPECIPPLFWGLDFYFHTFNKMYIQDVLQMEEYPGFSGAFVYKNHPIYKVDIAGCVVRAEERSKCFVYAVDDGTGVVNCCCWKQDFSFSNMDSTEQYQDLPEILKKKISQIKDGVNEFAESGYQLGDFVNIRGKVKMFRSSKEVVASYHQRIQDPMFEAKRMAELPSLYKFCYDKPFVLTDKIKQDIHERASQHVGPKSEKYYRKEMKLALVDTLQATTQQEITLQYLMALPAITKLLSTFPEDFENESNITGDIILEQTLSTLAEDGRIYKRPDMKMVYENLFVKSRLERIIKNILKKECEKPKYMEKGCYLLHILDELHKTLQYSKVNIACLTNCLNRLESQSEIISTKHKYYMPCPD